jgi:hypothetical protein
VVWSLFSSGNQTASLGNVDYKGVQYEVRNNLFPFPLTEVKTWDCSLSTLRSSLAAAQSDRFAADWLAHHNISNEARDVLDSARSVYRTFFELSSSLPWPIYKIGAWDVGLYQVRRALRESGQGEKALEVLANAHANLGRKLLQQLRTFGFIRGAERMFADETVG